MSTHELSPLLEESLSLWREVGDVTQIGALLNNLACEEFLQERYAQARSLFEEGLALQRAANNQRFIAVTLCNLGETMRMEGDLTTAALLVEEGRRVTESARRQGRNSLWVGQSG